MYITQKCHRHVHINIIKASVVKLNKSKPFIQYIATFTETIKFARLGCDAAVTVETCDDCGKKVSRVKTYVPN